MSFDEWCQEAEVDVGNHQLTILTGKTAQLTIGRDSATLVVPTHYASEERVADLLEMMGKPAAANFIRNKLPESKKIRSGDLGEIFASEYIGESTAYVMPIKRLRWKDHREMSMRGDDIIAIRIAEDGSPIEFMKGEIKSRAALTTATLHDARAALDKDDGLPSPHALSFVADRLHEIGEDEMGDVIDKAQLEDGIQPDQVSHLLFVFCGSNPQKLMHANLAAYVGTMNQLYVGLCVSAHQAFINDVYAKVIENGDDH